jgi:hypothetical protein
MEEVRFLKNKTWKIVSNNLKSYILTNVWKWWNIPKGTYGINRFPGPLPVSIERQHFNNLSSNPYWVCAKTDGVRYLMVCITYENKQYCILLNRKLEMFLLDIYMPSNAYNGTVLDGELVTNNQTNKYEFLVYDSVIICGEDTSKLPHSLRLGKSTHLLNNMMVSNRHDLSIHLKTFMKLNEMSIYIESIIPNLTHDTDGLIFTPENEIILTGTHKTMFKWKPKAKNTVDFWVERNYKKKNSFIIKLCKGKTMICLHDHYIYVPPHIIDNLPGILECSYNGPYNWQYLFERNDKTYPNSVYTMTKTLLNINEDILINEFENFN